MFYVRSRALGLFLRRFRAYQFCGIVAANLQHSAVDYAAYSDDLASNFGVVVDKGWRVCGTKFFLSVNLHWWRGPELRHLGKWISAPETAAIWRHIAACCRLPPMPPPECGIRGRSAAAAGVDVGTDCRCWQTVCLGGASNGRGRAKRGRRSGRRAARCWAGRSGGVLVCVQLVVREPCRQHGLAFVLQDGMAAPERVRNEPWRRRQG